MRPFITPGVTGPSVTQISRPPDRLSPVDGDWSTISQDSQGISGTQGGVRRVDSKFTRNKHFPVLSNMFPFAVYNLPRVLRGTPDDSNDWRKFRCHGGWALGSNASQTDGGDSDSHPEFIGNVAAAYDVWAPNSANAFFFWLEIASNGNTYSSRVLYGTDQTANSYSDSASTPSHAWDHNSAPWSNVGAWTTAPVPDGTHLPIAAVFCDPTNLRANVRQYLRTDVLGSTGSNCPYG